jgi:hypothetical protein
MGWKNLITAFTMSSFLATSAQGTILKSSSGQFDLWDSEIRTHATTYFNPHKDQFLSTIMGVCSFEWPWKKKYGIYRDRDFQDKDLVDRIPIKQVFSYKRKQQVDPKAQTKESNKPLTEKDMKKIDVAPLVIFLPGMFNEVDDSQNKRFMLSLSKRGHHVAVLPNPLSVDYITAKPNYKPGDYLKEAKTLYRAIKRIVLSYKMRGILKQDQVQLLGVSYGALMSSIITVLDSNDANIINGGTTLISPPLNFKKALERLDSYIEDTSDKFSGMYWSGKLYKFLRVCFSSGFKKRDEWAKGMTIYSGFQEYLVNSIKAWRKVNGLKEDLPYQNPKWERTFKFEHYLDWYASDVKAKLDLPEAELQYWVNQARTNGKPVRVLAAVDDWLNVPEEWQDFYEDQVIILPNGGHYGFRKLQWFEKFLTLAFPTI